MVRTQHLYCIPMGKDDVVLTGLYQTSDGVIHVSFDDLYDLNFFSSAVEVGADGYGYIPVYRPILAKKTNTPHRIGTSGLGFDPDTAFAWLNENSMMPVTKVYLGIKDDPENSILVWEKGMEVRPATKEIQELAREEQGDDFVVMPWDWSYYSNKLKDKKFNINEEMLRPYFELEQVKKGVFGLAEKLYGITFRKNTEIPVYHKEVEAFEVFDKDGKFLAVLYTDFHPRLGKRAGAWMTSYKDQWIDKKTGENSRPHVSVVMNFTKPTENKPALLTFNEVETFLHEFGHSLHGMFANSTYRSLSGTNVYWDFVELPSQIMENFAIEKDFLNTFARHYQTGEILPDELIKRLVDASNFNIAYACLRQLSFGLLDMAWYTRTTPFEGDVKAYEQEAWKKTQILPIVQEACMSTQFSHIFAGGYAAGYYSYKWAEVLDADAFSLFKQKGIFNQEVADSFRTNILSKGGTEHPMTLYKRFRGQEPTIDALLIRNGIKK